jgi:CBS-domain-containing membrane protein
MTTTESAATSLEGLLGTVGEAMTPQVVSVQVDTPADIALRRLEQAKVSGAPVVDGGRVAGVVTVRDLVAPVLTSGPAQTTGPFHRHEHHLTVYRVRDLMTTEPITASTGWSLARAVSAMDPSRHQPDSGGRRCRPAGRHRDSRRRAPRSGPAHPGTWSAGTPRIPDRA